MASLLTGKLTNINTHPSVPLATPQCWKTLPWHFILKYTFTCSNSIHLDVQRHTYWLIWPPAEAPHPLACSFTDNTAILDAFKIHGSNKRAHGLLVFTSFTDNSYVQLYNTIQPIAKILTQQGFRPSWQRQVFFVWNKCDAGKQLYYFMAQFSELALPSDLMVRNRIKTCMVYLMFYSAFYLVLLSLLNFTQFS